MKPLLAAEVASGRRRRRDGTVIKLQGAAESAPVRCVPDLPAESQAFLRGLTELIARDILQQHGYAVQAGKAPSDPELVGDRSC